MKVKQKGKIYSLAQMAVMTAVICVLSPLAVPVGPVPITLGTLAIYLAVYVLGWKKGTCSVLCYLLIGIVGLPVFSGYAGGIGKVLGPTGGYLLGFIPMAVVSGLMLQKFPGKVMQFVSLAAGLVICYTFGTAWYCFEAGVSLHDALWTCVIMFIPGDIVKIILAMLLGPAIKKGLVNARLI